ncbi:Putative SOS response-associated peptidase YedK [Fundidesulfovibrio magnetotacticus]|uniref:Abasic site processing protein n=1 Tax=Fundidesulfovibrio magnetotacticus TaxID=2730080 RepID=A0A6V8LN34_9BACT|nr:SOS response-associated peptidase [Fundidesulfovibrio magnetotacticus]GFK93074.1 Putative SOS response-associated peptidase YedK [Fundidesulfovibrio magnetotacticus]
MCGRFALGIPRRLVRERFQLPELPDAPERFNIAPGQLVEAVTASPAGRAAGLYRWGLVPFWARDASMASKLINARAETAAQKPAFRAALRHRRCLVPAQGFYEWSGPPGRRQPWFFTRRDGQPLALAGLWEHCELPGGEHLLTLALLTCEANALVAPAHHRMPVLLEPADDDAWLDPALQDPRGLAEILAPRDWPGVIRRRVSPRVNAAASEGPDLVEPWEPEGSLLDP